MMRQRGPTDAALSPGIYMSHGVLNQPFVSNGTSVNLNHSDILNSPKPDFMELSNRTKNDVISKVEKSKTSNRTLVRGKIRKKRSVGRPGLHHCSGESGRGLHSLKVTIRRTCQSHKIDAEKSQSETIRNGFIDHENQSSKFVCDMNRCQLDVSNQSSPSTLMESAPSKVDAYTSTLDGCSFTDRNSGLCEPGTNVFVEGIVWLETLGMLVLNVKWRGRAYVGTLLDASRQTFSPSYPDKGITSALSLLRGGGRGRQGRVPRNRFRNHHLSPHGHLHHHHHHLHRSFLHHHHRHGTTGSITTRSAAAAALAASSAEASKEGTPSKPTSPSSNHSPSNPDCGGPAPRRRGPKSRRGGVPCTSTAAAPTDVAAVDAGCDGSGNDGSGDSNLTSDILPPTLPCPHIGCDKYFGDLIGLRYHLSLGCHSSQEEKKTVPSLQYNGAHQHPLCSTVPIEASIPGPSASTASPPKLARAQLSTSPCSRHRYRKHSSSYVHKGEEEDGDDDESPAPPKLQRIASLTESQVPQDTVGNNNEPPAPSPAYSDISDDGTVPASTDSIGSLNSFLPPPPHSTITEQMESISVTAINGVSSIQQQQEAQSPSVFPLQLTVVKPDSSGHSRVEQQQPMITTTVSTAIRPLPPPHDNACSSMSSSDLGYFQAMGVPPTDINRLAAVVTAYTSSLSKRSPVLADRHHQQQISSPRPHYHPNDYPFSPYLAKHHPNPTVSNGTWPTSNGIQESPSSWSPLPSPLIRNHQPTTTKPATSLATALASSAGRTNLSFDGKLQHQLLPSPQNLQSPPFHHSGLSTKK